MPFFETGELNDAVKPRRKKNYEFDEGLDLLQECQFAQAALFREQGIRIDQVRRTVIDDDRIGKKRREIFLQSQSLQNGAVIKRTVERENTDFHTNLLGMV